MKKLEEALAVAVRVGNRMLEANLKKAIEEEKKAI